VTADNRVPRIALVSQSNVENPHKNTMFIKPHNFDILFGLHSDRTVILVWENSKNFLLSVIFPCARLLAWKRKWISHTKSINREPCNTTRLIAKVVFGNSIVFSHLELGVPVFWGTLSCSNLFYSVHVQCIQRYNAYNAKVQMMYK